MGSTSRSPHATPSSATAARAGELAVDLGAGVGAAGLALASRVEGLNVTLVEIDPALCALAADNARLNRLDDRVRVLLADAGNAEALPQGSVDRVFMNPPFNDPARANVSPDLRRRLAHVGEPGLLPRWVGAAARLLKPRGVLTMIWRADGLPEVLGALANEFGAVGVLPVLPRASASAIRVLVRAAKGETAVRLDYPALVLNDDQGRPTVAAEAILRSGETLPIAAI